MRIVYLDYQRILRHSAVTLGLTLLLVGCSPAEKPAVKPNSAAKPYALPNELSLDAHAERGPEGEVYVVGLTNFPDGMKLWVHIESGRLPLGASKVVASDDKVLVRKGTFRTSALWQEVPNPYFFPEMLKWRPDGAELKFLKRPFQAGSYKVRFEADFDSVWQTRDVLALLGGEGGKNLHGKILKLKDPDVIDSSKVLDDLATVAFPSLQPESRAISLVKTAVLSVPGKGRSAMDVEMNIKGLMQFGYIHMDGPLPSMRPAKGWSAKANNGYVYEVAFDLIDGDHGEVQAIWSVNLKTGSVKYVNESARDFSWTPNY